MACVAVASAIPTVGTHTLQRDFVDPMEEMIDLFVKTRQESWEQAQPKWEQLKIKHKIEPSVFNRLASSFQLPLQPPSPVNNTIPNYHAEALKKATEAQLDYVQLNKRAQPYITTLRNKDISRKKFRKAARKLAHMLAEEAKATLPRETIKVQTPLAMTDGVRIKKEDVVLVSIVRSGNALTNVFEKHFGSAPIGYIRMKRDEKTAIAESKAVDLPEILPHQRVFVLDPMIATGGSLSGALNEIVAKGVKPEQMTICSVIAAPEGLSRLSKEFPAVQVIVTQVDEGLDENKFIVPGLGDFGDRYFAKTK